MSIPRAVRPLEDAVEAIISSVFLELATHPDGHIDDLIRRSNCSEDEVRNAVRVLEQRGFVDITEEGNLEVGPPDLTMAQWASELEKAARTFRSEVPSLNRAYVTARGGDSSDNPDGFRRLHAAADVRQAAAMVQIGGAGRMVRLCANTPGALHALLSETDPSRDLDRSAYARIYGLYDTRLLEHPGVLDRLLQLRAQGEDVRLGKQVPLNGMVAEGSGCVLDLRGTLEPELEPSPVSGYLMTSPAIIPAMLRALHRAWELGMALPDQITGEIASLNQRDRTVITLLASGLSDATIARQLGVSSRTVERRVAHIMDALRCDSRFQAGVEASRRRLV